MAWVFLLLFLNIHSQFPPSQPKQLLGGSQVSDCLPEDFLPPVSSNCPNCLISLTKSNI